MRFEIACYKNKILEARKQKKINLVDVLQTDAVFLNVSKGQVASKTDLEKCFQTTDTDQIIMEILRNGEVQVGEKERSNQLELLVKEIATIVSDKCVNPETKRPYTVSIIQKAMADVHFNPSSTKSAKQQALEVIKSLQKKRALNISRALMKVLIHCKAFEAGRFRDLALPMFEETEEEKWTEDYEVTGLIQPGNYKKLVDLVSSSCRGNGVVQTLSLKDVVEN